jgi:hypothetical protein
MLLRTNAPRKNTQGCMQSPLLNAIESATQFGIFQKEPPPTVVYRGFELRERIEQYPTQTEALFSKTYRAA